MVQAFKQEGNQLPILVAVEDGKWIGFCAYDVYLDQKGSVGPMGVLMTGRHRGIGKALLYAALHEMKMSGQHHAVIKEAGPIEFYERICGARLIPLEAD
ncbi:GNAT family N-acetyltransferase [Bacillus sp. KH172YL63]|uniref:GNAT family N-acetyltransferase n=1 Tax=Bacillus sp. KH172YL63 TaxID=2709784 RepID=UPI0013E50B9F|nr:GNAT family N-acetyltransferase [Bacillus sp. KH172YL63]BCB04370.1 hypothetical protein KH172YL63_25030 [Bacillus sp. KH172YL63]